MKKQESSFFFASLLLCVFAFIFDVPAMAQKLTELPLNDVKLRDGFWREKLETNRTVTIPHNFKMCEQTGRIANFARAGGLEKGPHQGAFFNDSDVYKVIEGASYSLATHPDPQLDKYLDD